MKNQHNSKTRVILLGVYLLVVALLATSSFAPNISKEDLNYLYTIEPATQKDVLNDTNTNLSLYYLIRSGSLPNRLSRGDLILDLTPTLQRPSIIDSAGIFAFKNLTSEVVWNALSLTLNNSFGIISYRTGIDLSKSLNFNIDTGVNISLRSVFVNETLLPELNASATVTLYTIGYPSIRIVKDGHDCLECTILNYSNSTAVFTVPSIGLYQVVNQTALDIYVRVSRHVNFTASNITLTPVVYNDSLPSNVTLDISNDGIMELNYTSIMNSSITLTNLTESLNLYSAGCNCPDCSTVNEVSCLIPINITSVSQGVLELSNLNLSQDVINYTLSQFVNLTAIDLDDYFYDENNDTLNYSVVFKAATDTATLLYCSFDASLNCESGDTGVSDAGFGNAVFGFGIVINSSTNLTFTTADILDSSIGTFETWIIPEWNGSDTARNILLEMNASGNGNSISIFKNESGYLVAEILDNSANIYRVTYNISFWLDHQKHHIAFSWNTNDMQLVVDGIVRDTLSSATMPTGSSTLLFIGSSMNNTNHINATLDELKISDQVRNDYYNTSNVSYITDNSNILTLLPDHYYNGTRVVEFVSDDGHARTFSNAFNITVLPDTIAPVVTLLTSSGSVYSNNVTLSFNVTENIDLANCSIYHNLTGIYALNQSAAMIGFSNDTNFTLIAVPDLTNFIWSISCLDIYNNNAFASENRTINMVYPINAPYDQNATFNNTVKDGVYIDWNDVSDATEYTIQSSADLETFSTLVIVTDSNYTDVTAPDVENRFYRIIAQKPGYTNASDVILGKQNYTLTEKTSGTTKNWFGYFFNNSRIQKAKDLLNDIPNASAIVMYNSTLQITVTCNTATCPDACTLTTCNFNLSPGMQYEVLMDNNIGSMEYTYTGAVFDPVVVPLIKNSSSYGKNWISVPANTSLTTASALLNNISTANSVTKWDATNQKSLGWISLFGGLGTNFAIESRVGYEVSVTASYNWTQN